MGGAQTVDSTKYMKPVDTTPDWTAWTNIFGSGQGMSNKLVEQMTQATPQIRTADIPALQEIAARESEYNALASAAMEERLNPELAKGRKELVSQVVGDAAGGPNQELSNLWTKIGIEDAIATGAGTDGSFARSAIADSTRRSFIDDRTRLQDRLGSLLSSNPQPQVGLDPGALASAHSTATEANKSNLDNFQQQILGAQSNNINNFNNYAQQMFQSLSQQKQFQAQQANSLNQAKLTGAFQNANAGNGMNTAMIGGGAAIGGAVLAAAIAA